jgi:hypothetical protein
MAPGPTLAMRTLSTALLCLIAAAGCSGRNTAPVSGRVTLDGKPLAAATVIFQPESDQLNPGPGSHGRTDDKGDYSLQLMSGDAKGALLGKHKVSITAYEGGHEVPSSGSDIVFRKALLPAEYNSDTKLTFDVRPEGTTSANFDLKTMP